MSGFFVPLLRLYRATTIIFGPLAPLLLVYRRMLGKEDGARLGERLGRTNIPRPAGRLAWMHGASVGEGLALLPLAERLIGRGFNVLVTTGTVTSARVLALRLPTGATHQFAPIDVPTCVRRFLDHWRPDIVLFAESELWPNILCETKRRGAPMLLVNARLSRRSYRRWRFAPGMISSLLARLDLVLAQTRDDGVRLSRLGAPRVRVAGNLKYDVPPPPIDPARLAEMNAAIGPRPTWLAASTHPAEDEIIIDAHRALSQERSRILTIVAPRHPAHGPALAALAESRGVSVGLRSRGDVIERDTVFYIADTMGEMGLFYRLASVVFVGKSLGRAAGGQNPIEPAKLGAAVLHGPSVANFSEVYEAIDAANGAAVVADAATLARVLNMLFDDPAMARRMARAGGEAVQRLGGATEAVMGALEPYFMQMQIESR